MSAQTVHPKRVRSVRAMDGVVDGAVGAQWLQAFRGYVADPASMLL